MKRLDNKVAIITGGASGIGEATVELFIKEGAYVIIADIQDDYGNDLANRLGPNAVYVHTDVKDESDIKNVVEFAVKKFNRLDCMFNNAGIGGTGGLIEEIPIDGFDDTIAVLFRGMFLGMKHAAPIMKKQKSGSIINTSSVAGIRTGWGPHLYSACKAAIIQLTRTVATELGESNIRVNCICPGGIATPIFGRGLDLSQEAAKRVAESLKEHFTNIQPIKRPGLPIDIAQAALWLASDESSFVNGHALVVDGGATAGRPINEFRQIIVDVISKILTPEELAELAKKLGTQPKEDKN